MQEEIFILKTDQTHYSYFYMLMSLFYRDSLAQGREMHLAGRAVSDPLPPLGPFDVRLWNTLMPWQWALCKRLVRSTVLCFQVPMICWLLALQKHCMWGFWFIVLLKHHKSQLLGLVPRVSKAFQKSLWPSCLVTWSHLTSYMTSGDSAKPASPAKQPVFPTPERTPNQQNQESVTSCIWAFLR